METIDEFEKLMQRVVLEYDKMRTQRDAAVGAMEQLRREAAERLEGWQKALDRCDSRGVEIDRLDGEIAQLRCELAATAEGKHRVMEMLQAAREALQKIAEHAEKFRWHGEYAGDALQYVGNKARAALDSARREGETTTGSDFIPCVCEICGAGVWMAEFDGKTARGWCREHMPPTPTIVYNEPTAPPAEAAEEPQLTQRQQIHANLDAIFEKHGFGTPGDAAAGLFFAVRTYVYSLLSELAAPSAEAAEGPIKLPVRLTKGTDGHDKIIDALGCWFHGPHNPDAARQIAAALNRSAEDDKEINARNLLITEQIDEIARLREQLAHKHRVYVDAMDAGRERADERDAALRELDEARAERDAREAWMKINHKQIQSVMFIDNGDGKPWSLEDQCDWFSTFEEAVDAGRAERKEGGE